ncbi:Ferric siderophore transport system, periplasmic binding protein TonB [hydrothermal vent metagenome]|uniref:Ferric siderophore transport system, periplasmic binding protein TonB n=1 Tax=hydrothermal vent metagenome TaxID=652676 RepID=A0A3B0Y9U5_9ZZZZ
MSSALRKYLPRIVGVALVVGVGAAAVLSIQNFLDNKPDRPKRKVQQITLLKPPPPPPPPPKMEKLPEPELKEEVKVPELEEPEPLPELADEPPPGEALGVDADGSGAGDGFGLVGRKGGRGLLNGAGSPAMYYATQLQRRIEDVFAEHEEMRRKAYSIIAGIWVGKDGRILRVKLDSSTGDSQMDETMKEIIEHIQAMAVAPPPDMPQPVRLRISSTL